MTGAVREAISQAPWLVDALSDPTIGSRSISKRLAADGLDVTDRAIRKWRNQHKPEAAETRKPNTPALQSAKILVFDIETTPAHFEIDTYEQGRRYLSHKNITRPGEMLSWSAAWYSRPNTIMHRNVHHPDMLTDLWRLIDHASYVVTWNGDRFDLPKVRGYFARVGMPPFRPPKSIDLIKTARTLGLESSSLSYTARMLGVTPKQDGSVLTNWRACLDGDREELKRLRRYNNGDVRTTGELFDVLRPWIVHHPYLGFAAEGDTGVRCPRCGSDNTIPEGTIQAEVIRYRLHRCHECRGLYRSTIHSRIGYARAV